MRTGPGSSKYIEAREKGASAPFFSMPGKSKITPAFGEEKKNGEKHDGARPGRGQKEKTVEVPGFQVKGHLLQWENVAIQINNIALVTSSDVQPTQFPIWGLLIAVLGIALIPFMLPLGLVLYTYIYFTFYVWYRENEKKKQQKFLYIQLNSGKSFALLFQSQEFLNQVLQTFSNIFADGGRTGNNYYFDLKNSRIDRNSSVIQNLRQ